MADAASQPAPAPAAPQQAAPSAATGLAVTGSAVSLVPFVQWLLKALALPAMEPDQAMGAIVLLAILFHGIVKAFGAMAAWVQSMREAKAEKLARRDEWSPAERAAKLDGAA